MIHGCIWVILAATALLCGLSEKRIVNYPPSQIFKILWDRLGARPTGDERQGTHVRQGAPANFMEFKYAKGDVLPFEDGSFAYIYSEHFFEHLD
jgi:hypothetical protein